jgi:hypothetical protein
LSTGVVGVVASGNRFHHLFFLLWFLAAWGERPAYLGPMAHRWCTAISKGAAVLKQREPPTEPLAPLQYRAHVRIRIQKFLRFPLEREPAPYSLRSIEEMFSETGPCCDQTFGDDFYHDSGPIHDNLLRDLLPMTVEVGFRLSAPGSTKQLPLSGHTSHHDLVFKGLLSSWDGEIVADAVCMWTAGCDFRPVGSCARYLVARVERTKPFSPRLRRASVRAIKLIRRRITRWVSGLEIFRWLNRLGIDGDDVMDKREWAELLVEAIRSPTGVGNLSFHHWRFLDKLTLEYGFDYELSTDFALRGAEVTKLLEEVEDWERLEIWMTIAWQHVGWSTTTKDTERVTLKLLLRWPSALPRFEDIRWQTLPRCDPILRSVCNKARAEQSTSMEMESVPR